MVTSYVPFLNMFSTQCPIFYIGYIFFLQSAFNEKTIDTAPMLQTGSPGRFHLVCFLYLLLCFFLSFLLQVSRFLPHFPKTYSILIISIVHVVNMSKISIIFPSFLFFPLFLRSLASSYHQTLFSNWGQRTLLGHTGEDGEGARKRRQRCADSASHIYR